MSNTAELVKSLLEKAETIKWLTAQGKQDHDNSCHHSDPESYGPCNCGYAQDKKYRAVILNLLVKQFT